MIFVEKQFISCQWHLSMWLESNKKAWVRKGTRTKLDTKVVIRNRYSKNFRKIFRKTFITESNTCIAICLLRMFRKVFKKTFLRGRSAGCFWMYHYYNSPFDQRFCTNGIYLSKVSFRKTRKICEIYSKWTIETA